MLVQLSDAKATTVSADLDLRIDAASGLRIANLTLNTGEALQPYVDTLEAEGGSPPYVFEWPRLYELGGLSLEAASGAVSGIPRGPTPKGEPVEAVVMVRDVVGASAIASVVVRIRPAPLVIISDLPDGQVGEFYGVELLEEGGMRLGVTWTVASGTLPPGLGLVGGGLSRWTQLRGMPTAAGSYGFTLQASGSGFVATREYTVVIADRPLVIVTSTLPDADVGTPYSVFLVREGGTGPYQWDVVSGSLPAGIALNAAGEVSGTATNAGDASFEVRVRDALGQSVTGSLALHVDP